MTELDKQYLKWIGYNDYEIEEAEKEGDFYKGNQYDAFMAGVKVGLKMKVNTTTISDAPLLQKQPMTEKQKRCIDWIEETTGAVYEGGSVSDFISEHIEEARFKSELEAEANDPNG